MLFDFDNTPDIQPIFILVGGGEIGLSYALIEVDYYPEQHLELKISSFCERDTDTDTNPSLWSCKKDDLCRGPYLCNKCLFIKKHKKMWFLAKNKMNNDYGFISINKCDNSSFIFTSINNNEIIKEKMTDLLYENCVYGY